MIDVSCMHGLRALSPDRQQWHGRYTGDLRRSKCIVFLMSPVKAWKEKVNAKKIRGKASEGVHTHRSEYGHVFEGEDFVKTNGLDGLQHVPNLQKSTKNTT